MLVSEVVRGKALAHIVDAATVRDASGRPVELKRLQPDGSIVAETDVDGGTAVETAPADQTEAADSPDSADGGADPESTDVGEREVEGAADRR